ncbi:hypothetical protein DPMN_025012 [Dreissena polymorpha]|uniref:Uncharacterized protein n=1 Tax=Dreissena polymorpha TaxID=45954 RepID=A0A9D4LNI4_DREPO|nr:hypothetical protein DPMN_025012 [Dreissena polymorpha]
MFASLQFFGCLPVSNDLWKMEEMADVAFTAQACSTLLGSLSRPAALRTLMIFSNLSTPSSHMCRRDVVVNQAC